MAHYGRPGGFTPFQYGYTLGPGSEANNGDYAVYNQYAAQQQAAAAAAAVGQSPNNITIQGRMEVRQWWMASCSRRCHEFSLCCAVQLECCHAPS